MFNGMDISFMIMSLFCMFLWHEIGHILVFRFFGYRPKLEFTGWALSVGQNVILGLTRFEVLYVSVAGIFLGATPWLIGNLLLNLEIPYLVAVVYATACCFDLSWCFTAVFEMNDFETMREYHKRELIELEKIQGE